MAEEETKEAPKKKAGKLPIIVACVVMLFTGGFFGLKMKGGKEAPKAKVVALGEVLPLEEFLVNISDGSSTKTYLRTKIALQLKKDVPKEEVSKHTEMIQHEINMALMQLSVSEVSSLAGKQKLLKNLLKAVNDRLNKVLGEKAGIEGDSSSQPVQDLYLLSFAYQ